MARASAARIARGALAASAVLLLAATAGRADLPDWSAVADEEVVLALTQDEDGSTRETKIWLVVVDGQGYIRTTPSTTWGANAARTGQVTLRIRDAEYPLGVEFVEDAALRERIVAAFRDKYGWFDAAMNVFRGSHPPIMRLVAR